MPEVRPERSEWRDEELSKRHRLYGWDCPAVDIDFLMVEYDLGKPVALVEYKNREKPQEFDYRQTNFAAIVELANRARIPAICCQYNKSFTRFWPEALNEPAKKWLPGRRTLTEKQWVQTLYAIRGRALPEDIGNQLNSFDKEET